MRVLLALAAFALAPIAFAPAASATFVCDPVAYAWCAGDHQAACREQTGFGTTPNELASVHGGGEARCQGPASWTNVGATVQVLNPATGAPVVFADASWYGGSDATGTFRGVTATLGNTGAGWTDDHGTCRVRAGSTSTACADAPPGPPAGLPWGRTLP